MIILGTAHNLKFILKYALPFNRKKFQYVHKMSDSSVRDLVRYSTNNSWPPAHASYC